jgi:hypothetical protein
MSFQLLAFFIMTFRPAPTEAQIAMTLPREEGGPPTVSFPTVSDDKPVRYIIKAEANDNGTVKRISIQEVDTANEPADVGSDLVKYRDELKKMREKHREKPVKLTLEIEPKLIQEYVVQLLDIGILAGFTDIAPVPTDPRKR